MSKNIKINTVLEKLVPKVGFSVYIFTVALLKPKPSHLINIKSLPLLLKIDGVRPRIIAPKGNYVALLWPTQS